MDETQLYLTILQEECAEVIQIVSKIFRFGPEDWHPDDLYKVQNKDRLVHELADILTVIDLLKENGFLERMRDESEIKKLKELKIKKIEKYKTRGTDGPRF